MGLIPAPSFNGEYVVQADGMDNICHSGVLLVPGVPNMGFRLFNLLRVNRVNR